MPIGFYDLFIHLHILSLVLLMIEIALLGLYGGRKLL